MLYEVITHWGLYVQDEAGRWAEALIGFRADVGFLVELLGVATPAEVRVQAAPRAVGAVERAAVPGVSYNFV